MPGARATRSRRIGSMLLNNDRLLLRMDLINIYQCFCDRTRLRILHLLAHSPLCVCHFQAILSEPQVKVSKHLAYLRTRGLVATNREQNWIIYSLPKRPATELNKNLKCLQDCVQTDAIFKRDLEKLAKLRKTCCEPTRLFGKTSNRRKTNGKTKSPLHLRS
jgi:ArsR family transcriptional regulator, arsenate/arsenite/antimonite-responsive transcriptional repressor